MRVFICSEPITNDAPDKAENGFLQKMCDDGLPLACALGTGAIDIQRPMHEVQKRVLAHNKTIKDSARHVKLHAADGVHLIELGHMAMSFTILKGFGAPADVSSAKVDARSAPARDGEAVSDSFHHPAGRRRVKLL